MGNQKDVKFDKNKYLQNYSKEHYDRVLALVPKGMKETIRSRSNACGLTMTQYLIMTMGFYEDHKGDLR